ncbi:MAG: hypothetical protein JRI33_03075 [Deltaproteobacteria bacterium]|nr:hypothetical protein [Deltaproteobacteria bacterium]MBW2097531.1 hypothetical protein [Deltaproteobacteria bacterium]
MKYLKRRTSNIERPTSNIEWGKMKLNPWSAAEVAIRALPQKRFAFCRVSIAGRIALPLSVCNE